MVIGAVLLLVLVGALLYFLWSRRKYYLAAYKIGGPWGLPFIGMAHRYSNMSETLYHLGHYAEANNVKTYHTWVGTMPALYTTDPKIIEVVLNSPSCYNKPSSYNAIKDAIGDGLLTIKAPMWNKHRKLLNPCFGYRLLLTMFAKFNNSARSLCDNLDKCANQGEVQIKDYVFESALKSSIETTMGIDFQKKSDKKILQIFESMMQLINYRALRPWFQSEALWSLTRTSKQLSEILISAKTFIQNLIEVKIKVLDEQNNNAQETNKKSIDIEKTSHVFIDQAISILQRNEFTVEDIVSHANLLVIAAYETSATALYSALVMLAIHPDVQERLFNEISSLYPSTEFNVTQESIKDMVYLDMCINETLRLAPSIPLIGRLCTEDISLSPYISVYSGTQVVIDIFNLHRNKDIWGPDALKFNPDNFLPANMADKHSCSFIPFSKGPRNCIGWQYAGMLLKVMLPHLVRRFRFSTSVCLDDLKYSQSISLKYVNPPALKIEVR